jgi:hypothetical protein
MNPTGCNSAPDYPYFITTKPLLVKKVAVPKGTKLVYEEQFFKKGEQSKIMSEEKLTDIELPAAQPIMWGGVPVTAIRRFFNTEMRGYSVYADFERLTNDKKTGFSQLWQSCSSDLGVLVKNADDWSFNTQNIADIDDCSVTYQRYFKEDTAQQQFLNSLYSELVKVGSK